MTAQLWEIRGRQTGERQKEDKEEEEATGYWPRLSEKSTVSRNKWQIESFPP